MRLTNVFTLACGCLVVGVVVAQVAWLQAQPPQPPPPVAKVQSVQPPDPTSLYRMNDVGKALNLSPQQTNRLNQLTNDLQGVYKAHYGKLSTLSAAEQAARRQELQGQYVNDWHQRATDVFNKEQLQRYQQLGYQYGGFNTLTNPEVQRRLNLTPAQRKQLPALVNWNNQQWHDLTNSGITDPLQANQRYQVFLQQRQQRFSGFLSPAQQEAWRGLVGEPFLFHPNFTQRR